MNLKQIPSDKYDFAFSFAGEDRKTVEEIKEVLLDKGYSVFYDNDFNYELVGKDLYRYLRTIYRDKCRYVVCFISDYYIKKVWTTLEMTAIKERLMSTFFASDFLIPIFLNNTVVIQDIPSFIGIYTHKTVKETSKLLIDKINNALVEDNYLYNVDNCIQYIYENVYRFLIAKKHFVNKADNKIVLRFYNAQYTFRIENEQHFNLPCLLIYFENASNPDVFISWKRANLLRFEITYFYQLRDTETDLNINDLIEKISNYMIERVEQNHEQI